MLVAFYVYICMAIVSGLHSWTFFKWNSINLLWNGINTECDLLEIVVHHRESLINELYFMPELGGMYELQYFV